MIFALSMLLALAAFVCYVMVVIQIFQHGETGMGLACSIGLLACGLGYLLAFIYGWVKAGPWRLNNIMLVWTACFVINLILSFLAPSPFAGFNVPAAPR
jgi:hypothetical protein